MQALRVATQRVGVRGGVRRNGVRRRVAEARAVESKCASQSAMNTIVSSSSKSGVMASSNVSIRGLHSTVAIKYAGASGSDEKTILMMPALSPSMTTGNIASWVKKEGDKIVAGDVMAEIETDKATVAFEATEDGFLAKILVAAGTKDIPVSEPIAVIVPKKDMVAKFANFTLPAKGASAPASSAPAPASSSSSSSTSSSPKVASSPKPSVAHTVMTMPSLSPTMEDGVIAVWKKKEGDKITAGDILAEIETDKATVAFEATEDGFLAKILQTASSTRVKVNDPIAIVVDKKGDIDAVKDYNPLASSGAETAAAATSSSSSTSASAASTPSSSSSSSSSSSISADGRVVASPYAKLLAKEKSLPLNEMSGSGPNGRIIAADVLSFVPSKASASASTSKAAASSSASSHAAPDFGDFEDLSISNIRRITAERLSHSKQTIPHYYLTMECDVEELMKVRATLNAAATKGEYKLSVNDFIVKASALAMKKVPEANSEWRGDVIRRYHNVDINVAVSTDAGLLTPIIRDADLKGLVEIADGVKKAALKAKENKLTPADLSTGTFTISNLGMFGIDQFSAVINPPQACILAVGASKAKVIPNPAAATSSSASSAPAPFVVRNYMSVTLSCDHRVVDGAVGARWLQAFKDLIENPMKLLL